MKWDQLLSSMDEETFKNLSYAVSCETNRRAVITAETLPELNEHELNTLRSCSNFSVPSFQAIKLYRDRVKCSVGEAKIKCEKALQSFYAKAE